MDGKKATAIRLQNLADLGLLLLVHHQSGSGSMLKDFANAFASLGRAFEVLVGVDSLGNGSTLRRKRIDAELHTPQQCGKDDFFVSIPLQKKQVFASSF